ncbi:MAG: UbiA family prenyltransferase [Oscillibacter sp.]|nr:UbiA family prenyltransferase [Oscillibacter sp.]
MRAYIKIARFDHWIKQLFILPGAWLAWIMVPTGGRPLLSLALGLAATSLAASANYVINEWLDAAFDKYHPVKKNRPCVTGGMNPKLVYAEYLFFLLLALVTAFLIDMPVFLMIVILLFMGILYNVKPLRTKDIPYVDVLSESVNNALRFAIGWFCVAPTYYPPASFVMGYWMAGAFLMAAKRFAEYRMIGDARRASLYRKSFAGYSELSLLLLSVFFGFLAVFFCGVFLIKYRIELLLLIPFVCGLFCYYLRICYQPDSAAQKPEKLFREKWLMVYVILLMAMCVILYHVQIPCLDMFLQTNLVSIP